MATTLRDAERGLRQIKARIESERIMNGLVGRVFNSQSWTGIGLSDEEIARREREPWRYRTSPSPQFAQQEQNPHAS